MTQLAKRKMVISARGPQGGYKLAKAPGEYFVGDILRATEGSLAPVICLEDGQPICENEAQCATIELWRDVQEAINKVIDNTTLADLLQRQNNKHCCSQELCREKKSKV